MQVCPNCSHRNRPGVVFCENCGASLIGDSPLHTKSISGGKDNGTTVSMAVKSALQGAGSDIFGKGAMLRIEIEGAEPILLKPKPETVFGRRDPATGLMPDVDLTPFAGYRMGVSRRHAAVRQNIENRLDLWDMGSSNGTYLNGTKLDPNKPYTLHDGDEIRMGQMVMRVFYQQAVTIDPAAPPGTTHVLAPESDEQPSAAADVTIPPVPRSPATPASPPIAPASPPPSADKPTGTGSLGPDSPGGKPAGQT
ncbi:MAG TPA: FHA domain-containing protein [Aggregatilineales bacterium]|nr:FHA domain-containing protein [Aggregatilineales bacterium]